MSFYFKFVLCYCSLTQAIFRVFPPPRERFNPISVLQLSRYHQSNTHFKTNLHPLKAIIHALHTPFQLSAQSNIERAAFRSQVTNFASNEMNPAAVVSGLHCDGCDGGSGGLFSPGGWPFAPLGTLDHPRSGMCLGL